MKAIVRGSCPPDHPIYTGEVRVQSVSKLKPEPEESLESEQETQDSPTEDARDMESKVEA